jgi:hypothetical protein
MIGKARLTLQRKLLEKLEESLGLHPESLDFGRISFEGLLQSAEIIYAIANLPTKILIKCPACNGQGVRDGLELPEMSEAMRFSMACYDCMGSGRLYMTEHKCRNVACDHNCYFCKGTGYQLEGESNGS